MNKAELPLQIFRNFWFVRVYRVYLKFEKFLRKNEKIRILKVFHTYHSSLFKVKNSLCIHSESMRNLP